MGSQSAGQQEVLSDACRLLPAVLDGAAISDPEGIYASFPKTDKTADGFQDFTNLQVVHAVDTFAWWLHDTYGKSSTFETLGYIGVSDLRYVIFFYGCIKAGYKALFFSPRNTTAQNACLIEQNQCKKVFFSEKFTTLAGDLFAHIGPAKLATQPFPAFESWHKKYQKAYPYTKTFQEARYDPIVVLHSSGSTGPPKSITQNHQYFINMHRPPPLIPGKKPGGYTLWNFGNPGFAFSPFPFYHLAGLQSICVMPVFYARCAAICGYPDRPATPEMVLRILEQRTVRLLYSPPSIIEGLLQQPGAVQYIKQLDNILYAGGPLSVPTGDELIKHTQLSSCYGFTETGALACFVPEPSGWQFFEWHPLLHLKMKPALDGAYEMVLERDLESDPYRGIGATLLREQEQYRTKDLFIPHPSKPDLWRFCGRSDDIIVLSNGQKWNPLPTEGLVGTHDGLSGVLATGTGYLQPALLLESKTDSYSEQQLVESVWPLVKQSNANTQRYGRIVRSKVAVVRPHSFLRTPKGTISRKATVKLLQQTIDDVYARRYPTDGPESCLRVEDASSLDAFINLTRSCILRESTIEEIDNSTDFFVAGMDSLDAVEVGRSLCHGLLPVFATEQLNFIGARLIFNNPTIDSLGSAIYETLSTQQKQVVQESKHDVSLMSKHALNFTSPYPHKAKGLKHFGLAISGTTGSLGSYLLEWALRDTSINRIVCLNRDPNAEVRTKRLLPQAENGAWRKVTFLLFKPEQEGLGLSDSNLKHLQSTEAVVHCAWKVDFNQILNSFEPQIEGVARLARITSSSSQYQRIFFVSSTSAVSGSTIQSGNTVTVPEVVPKSLDVAAPMGYGRSKNISERLLAAAAEAYGLPVTILRVGQIAGADPFMPDREKDKRKTQPSDRTWNPSEWVPLLIATSTALKKVPSDLPAVNWLSVTNLVAVISDIVSIDISQDGLKVYNLVNPKETHWETLAAGICAMIGDGCKTVPFEDWIRELESHDAETSDNLRRLPALKIMPFLKDVNGRSGEASCKYSTENGTKVSPSLASVKPITTPLMQFWMGQWGMSEAKGKSKARFS